MASTSASSPNVWPQELERESDASALSLVGQVRQGVADHLAVFHEELGLVSAEEARAQEQYVEKAFAEGNVQAVRQLWSEYASASAQQDRSRRRSEYFRNFRDPLDDMQRRGVISEKSYREWRVWMEDTQRSFSEKKGSKEIFEAYRKDREELAKDREELLKETSSEKITDPELAAKIKHLAEDRIWFNELEFTARKNLIDHIRADLAVKGTEKERQELKKQAETILLAATKEPQPALHRDKVGTWLRRIFEEGPKKGAAFSDLVAFVHGSGAKSLQGLIKTWREVAVKFWYARKDPAFAGVKTGFINTKGFLWLHYEDRLKYVQSMRDQAAEARSLRSAALSRIGASAFALGRRGKERWLNEYVFNGSHSLKELRSIIAGNMSVRLRDKVKIFDRYSKAKNRAEKYNGLRGMTVPARGEFLEEKYPRQKSFVVEMELRLDHLEKNRPKFLVIRNAMDRRDWDDALELIADEEKKELRLEDRKELHSMKEYIRLHRKHTDAHQEQLVEKKEETEQIDALIDSLPVDLQDLVLTIAEDGADCVRMFGWGLYNREWCNRRGYLDSEREQNAIRTGKEMALQKVRDKRRGVVNEDIGGSTGEKEFVRLSRTSATNVCLNIADGGAKTALARTVYARRSDHSAWYWTNIILHRSGSPMHLDQQVAENKKIHRIGRILRKLEGKNQRYSYRGAAASLKQKVRNPSKNESSSGQNGVRTGGASLAQAA